MTVDLGESVTETEARMAYVLAFQECNEMVFKAARAGSIISDEELSRAVEVMNRNFAVLVAQEFVREGSIKFPEGGGADDND